MVRTVNISHLNGTRYTKFCEILNLLQAEQYETYFVTQCRTMCPETTINIDRWYQFLLIKLQPRMFIHTTKPRFHNDLRWQKYQVLYSLFTEIESYLQLKKNDS